MKLSQNLAVKQAQSLVMTPQLVQSIKLLQFSSQELADFVRDEIEKNPLLEAGIPVAEQERRGQGTAPEEKSGETGAIRGMDAVDAVSPEMGVDAASREASLDASFENVYDSGTAGAEQSGRQSAGTGLAGSGPSTVSGSDADFDAFIGEIVSLTDHLERQAALAFSREEDRGIAFWIIHALDDDGYLRESIAETAAATGSDPDRVKWVLEQFQQFEPVGIGSQNLSECLAIQLRERNRLDPAMAVLVANLDMVARREFGPLRELCGVDQEDFADMLAELRTLDPRPAAQFTDVTAEAVVPDVIVSATENGGWSIELNAETLPRVLINQSYHRELVGKARDEADKEFVSDCLGTANWLVKSLDQRAQTILKVATEIVKQQDMFFARGVQHLKPLNLKAVAEAINMHESTVSRVTSNKYLACERGTFELKYFFSSALGSTDGEAAFASEAIRHRIRNLIGAESPDAILSDETIAEQLRQNGVDVARRTVAKYREAMRIPSSVQRRREKRQARS